MDDLTLEQSIAQLLTKVPAPVQQFVLNELGTTTNLMMAAHNLHIDQAGVLERELLLMLLGQEDPAQFATALKEAGVDEATTQAILKDVNERVFKRLRTQERAEGVAPATPTAPQERAWVEVTPKPTSAPTTPAPTYTAQPAQQATQRPPQTAVPSVAPIRTMAADMAEAQHPTQRPRVPQQLPGAPIPVPPPIPHQELPPIQPSAPAQPIARPAPPPQPPLPPKTYGADPYREPIG